MKVYGTSGDAEDFSHLWQLSSENHEITKLSLQVKWGRGPFESKLKEGISKKAAEPYLSALKLAGVYSTVVIPEAPSVWPQQKAEVLTGCQKRFFMTYFPEMANKLEGGN